MLENHSVCTVGSKAMIETKETLVYGHKARVYEVIQPLWAFCP
jgi:hypothetical protein